jgi:hypothetical protein
MNLLIPIVMGTTIVAYIHCFNSTMQLMKSPITLQELFLIRYQQIKSLTI